MKNDNTKTIELILLAVAAVIALCSAVLLVCRAANRFDSSVIADTRLVVYEGPESLRDAAAEDIAVLNEQKRDISLMHCTDTTVSVNGIELYVYDTNVNLSRSWDSNYLPMLSRTPVTYFDFDGTAVITVTVPDIDIESVQISPLSYGIEPEIKGHSVTFTVTENDAYTLTFNGVASRAVHIFANAIEEDAPSPDDENVIYLGPGEWDADTIRPKDGQTVYIAGGAVVHGTINCNGRSNVTVCGRGIIDGSQYETWGKSIAYVPLCFDNCENITIKDIIVLNSNAWACQGYNSVNGVIDGLKIISARPNGDGITLQSCRNYTVKNCFVRSWDDCLVVKNYAGSSENIKFSDCQLWTDLAQSMEIGYETNKGKLPEVYIKDVTFENITVLGAFHKPVISIHNADDALVSDIVFRDITVERSTLGAGDAKSMPFFIDLHITRDSNWSSTSQRGSIDNVLIENVTLLDGEYKGCRIDGHDADHAVSNVTIRNLTVLGEKITDFEQGLFDIEERSTSNLIIE